MTTQELNIVECDNCGRVFGHELCELDELHCPHCGYCSDICDFPDLYHTPEHTDSIVSIVKKHD